MRAGSVVRTESHRKGGGEIRGRYGGTYRVGERDGEQKG